MSIQVNYPSKYFEASLSAKERIPETITPNLTANSDGVTPLDNLIAQGNEAEIKFLKTKHAEMLCKAIKDTDALSVETTNAIFKLLHDTVHRVNGAYTFEGFEHSFASASGVSAMNYITRIKKEYTVEEIEEGLTGLGFYNFAKNVSWTDNSLVPNDKGEFSAGNKYLQACLHFFSTHEQDFFYKNARGLTVFHELASSDKNLAKIAALSKILNIDLTGCVDEYGETVLSTMTANSCKKLVRWFFNQYGGEAINDSYTIADGNNPQVNSACIMVNNAAKFGVHAQEYISNIDESKLDDSAKSCMNYYNPKSKIDLSEIQSMPADMMKEKSMIKQDGVYITFNKIIANNKVDLANTAATPAKK